MWGAVSSGYDVHHMIVMSKQGSFLACPAIPGSIAAWTLCRMSALSRSSLSLSLQLLLQSLLFEIKRCLVFYSATLTCSCVCVVAQKWNAAAGTGEAAPWGDSEESESSLLWHGGSVCPAWPLAQAHEGQVRKFKSRVAHTRLPCLLQTCLRLDCFQQFWRKKKTHFILLLPGTYFNEA